MFNILSHTEMQVKTTLRLDLTSVSLAISKKANKKYWPVQGGGGGKEFSYTACEGVN
jgi:hypothetical protein